MEKETNYNSLIKQEYDLLNNSLHNSIKIIKEKENKRKYKKKDILNKIDMLIRVLENELNFTNFYNTENISQSFVELIYEYYRKVNSSISNFQDINFSNIMEILNSLLSETERIKLLNNLSNIKNNAVIIGANGSGKSTFVSKLGSSTLSNLSVIPAQKLLIFDIDTYDRDKVTIDSYRKYIYNNNINTLKNITNSHQVRESFVHPFTLLITLLVKDYTEIATQKLRKVTGFKNTKPIWDTLEEIYSKIIPEINFSINPTDRSVSIKKDKDDYSLNELSDGEKCILFYIGNVLIAKENSYIVVDEPETFLNPSIYNKLWDLLINERPDCQFIFTSHNMEFINARANTTFVWCRNYQVPNNFDLQILDREYPIPTILLTELIGSRKKILFCEGNYNSWDYKIYSQLFMDTYTIKPMNGHVQVIQSTRMFNKMSDWLNNEALGIIDSDSMDNAKIKAYTKDNIHVLPYNEIEMLLLNEKVILDVFKYNHGEDGAKNILEIFKKEFFLEIEKNIEKIIFQTIKKNVDHELQKSFINDQKIKSVDEIQTELDNFGTKFDIQSEKENLSKKIFELLTTKNYEELLKLCSLKEQILNGLGNKFLTKNYGNLAIKRISLNTELRATLKGNLFPDIS